MKKESAGLLMFRIRGGILEVLLAHPGGPYWSHKDLGAWTIPKGEIDGDEDPLKTALREFQEETGLEPQPPFLCLGSITQKAGKKVYAWAFRGDCDPARLVSNSVQIEWPPRSGKKIAIPEIDRAQFFAMGEAREKINPAQASLLAALEKATPGQSSAP